MWFSIHFLYFLGEKLFLTFELANKKGINIIGAQDGVSLKDITSTYAYTDKKENKSFLIYKEIQRGTVAKSYMRKGFL
jgi:hypothetical protein